MRKYFHSLPFRLHSARSVINCILKIGNFPSFNCYKLTNLQESVSWCTYHINWKFSFFYFGKILRFLNKKSEYKSKRNFPNYVNTNYSVRVIFIKSTFFSKFKKIETDSLFNKNSCIGSDQIKNKISKILLSVFWSLGNICTLRTSNVFTKKI